MPTTVADIIRVMELFAPLRLAAAWDNSGLQIGNVDRPVKKIMTALDPTIEVIHHAVAESVDLLITHHPLFFSAVKTIDLRTPIGMIIDSAIQHHLTIYSAHTNFDSADKGLNDILSSKIGLLNLSALDALPVRDGTIGNDICGLGRIGDLQQPIPVTTLCGLLKESLCLESLRMIGDPQLMVTRVAVCTGSGSSLLDLFFSSDAQVYITGDIRYHDARRIEENYRALIDIGHFSSEHLIVVALRDRLASVLADTAPDVTVVACTVEKDPFIVI